MIFKGDETTHKKARSASDGFEHGFKDLTEVDALSAEVKTLTAEYLREAILQLSGTPRDDLAALLSEPNDFVLHSGPPTFELRAQLVGNVEDLAPAGLEHPDVAFDNLTPTIHKVGEGIEMRYGGIAEWRLGPGAYAKKVFRPTSERRIA